MKQGWEIKKLGEVLTIERGGSPRPIEKYLTNSSSGINWIKISDATASNKYIFETKEKITKEGLNKTRMVNEGDFILSNSMSFGRPYIMKTSGCIHDGWLVFKQNGKKVFEIEFLYYLLSSPYVSKQFDYLAAGSTVRNLNIALVSSVQVPIPSLPVQKQIVSILDKCFAAIDKVKANAEQNLKNAKELFESYLQGVFEKKGKGWEEKKLGEIADIEYGYTDKASILGDYRYIRITDINNEGLLSDNEKVYIRATDENGSFVLYQNDLLMARTGATFAKVLFYENREPSIFASYLIKIKFKTEIDNKFYWYFSKSKMYWKQANKLQSGAAQPQFNGNALKQVLFTFPLLKEQQFIVRQLDTLRKETQKLEMAYNKKITGLEELKKSILQRAFSGELKRKEI